MVTALGLICAVHGTNAALPALVEALNHGDSYPSVKVFSIVFKGSEKRTSVGVMMYDDQWKYDLK